MKETKAILKRAKAEFAEFDVRPGDGIMINGGWDARDWINENFGNGTAEIFRDTVPEGWVQVGGTRNTHHPGTGPLDDYVEWLCLKVQ